MPFRDILTALWLSVKSVKSKSALQLSRELGCRYKAAWVFLMKMREAIATRREDTFSKARSTSTANMRYSVADATVTAAGPKRRKQARRSSLFDRASAEDLTA
jgi:hypothetical protein